MQLRNIYIFIFLYCFCLNFYPQERLYAINDNTGKMGLVNFMGEFIIQPTFDLITDLNDQQHDWEKTQIFIVKKDSLFGTIDYFGKTILKPEYNSIFCKQDTCIVKKNNLCGIIDSRGKVIIPIQYSNIYFRSENKYQVQNKQKKWGYINQNNQLIIPYQFEDSNPFHNGRAKICLNIDTNNERCGFINENGEMIIPQDFYNFVGDFYNGLASFQDKNNKFGFINKVGNIAIQAKYVSVKDFSFGSAEVNIECIQFDDYGTCKSILIDKFGKNILPKNTEIVRSFKKENFTVIANNKTHKQGMIDNSGKIIIPLLYDDVGNIEGNYIKIFNTSENYGNLLGLHHSNGKLIFSPKYDADFFNITDKYIFVSTPNNELKGVLDLSGKIIIPIIYDSIEFENDVFVVSKNENSQYSYFNKFGKLLNKNKKYVYASIFENNFATIISKDYYEIIDKKEKIIYKVSNEYFFGTLKNKYLILKNKATNKSGILDLKGNIIVPFIYANLQFLDNYLLLVKQLDKFGIINFANEKIIEIGCSTNNFMVSKGKIRYEDESKKVSYFDLKGNQLPESVALQSFFYYEN